MTKAELLKKHPALVAEIQVSAINEERERTKKCIASFTDPAKAVEAILDNRHFTLKEQMEMKLKEIKQIVYNSPEAQRARDEKLLDAELGEIKKYNQ